MEWEECFDVPGATGYKYTPTELGQRLRLRVTVTNSAGSIEAFSPLSNPVQEFAAAPGWRLDSYSLEEWGIPSTSIQSSGPVALKLNNGATISCKSSTGAGTISPLDKGTVTITPSSCEYVNHKTCTVKNAFISAKLSLVNINGVVYEKYTSTGPLMGFELSGTGCSWFGAGYFSFYGSFAGSITGFESTTLTENSTQATNTTAKTSMAIFGESGYIESSFSQYLTGKYAGDLLAAW